jgi:hypothetical protein
MGWLTRMAGLSIDNLLSAEIVTADGKIRRTSPTEEPELFWAIRGGGGNFGIVTEFEFRLHDVGPTVQVGLLFWPLDQGREVLRLGREVLATLPADLNIIIAGLNAPPEPFVPEQHRMQPGYAFVVAGFGVPERHDEVMTRIRQALPPLWEFASPMPYVALQQLLDEANAWGLHNYEKGTYVEALTDDVIDVVFEKLPEKSSPLSLLIFYSLDGAYSAVGEQDTAFGGGRSPRFAIFIVAVCPTPDLLPLDRAWVRSTWEALLPHTVGIGSYVNAMTEGEEDRVRASYGPEKYERLVRAKQIYDPDNVFHRNANIRP